MQGNPSMPDTEGGWLGRTLRPARILRAHGAGELSSTQASRTQNPFKGSLCIDKLFGMATGTFGSTTGIRGEVKFKRCLVFSSGWLQLALQD